MKSPLDILDEKLTLLRKEFSVNHDKIDDYEAQIHELKLHQTEIKILITNYEVAMIKLKGN